MISITINGLDDFRKDVAQAPDDLKKQVGIAMSKSVNQILVTARKLAPVKTGNLVKSIQADVLKDGFEGIVYQDYNIAMYGPFMEYGTAAHEIVPVDKKALFWKGALNPYKRVMHPGTQPHPFMNPAFEQNVEKIKEFFTDAIGDVILRVAGKA